MEEALIQAALNSGATNIHVLIAGDGEEDNYVTSHMPLPKKFEVLAELTKIPDDWRKLGIYGSLNGKKIPNFNLEKVRKKKDNNFTWENGHVLERLNGNKTLSWKSYTVYEDQQVYNFVMVFDLQPFRLITGGLNCFEYWMDVDKEYVYEKLDMLIDELSKMKDFKWDIVENMKVDEAAMSTRKPDMSTMKSDTSTRKPDMSMDEARH